MCLIWDITCMLISFLFKPIISICCFVFRCNFISNYLHIWWTIILICIMMLFIFFSTHWNKTHTWFYCWPSTIHQVTHHVCSSSTSWASPSWNRRLMMHGTTFTKLNLFFSKIAAKKSIQMFCIICWSSKSHIGSVFEYCLSSIRLKWSIIFCHAI